VKISKESTVDFSSSKNLMDVSECPITRKMYLSNCNMGKLAWLRHKDTRPQILDVSECNIRAIDTEAIVGIETLNIAKNFITSKVDTEVTIDYSGNPCQPEDGIEDSRMW